MKAIIWDMDGTITDTETYWMLNIFRLLEYCGVPDARGKAAPWYGSSYSGTLKSYLASPDCRIDWTFEQCNTWCRNYINTHTYAAGAPLKPGAADTLQACRALGLSTYLVSATERQALKYTLNRLNIGQYFDFFESTCFQAMDKRDPALFHRCAARMGVETRDCLLVDDSLYSLESGRAAGMTVWAIEDGKHEKVRHLIRACAHRYFENHAQLRQALLEECAE